tara:strand:+ start:1406 stop:1555 length:150 start_codon:yes stop_codon:yes gene_type:complete
MRKDVNEVEAMTDEELEEYEQQLWKDWKVANAVKDLRKMKAELQRVAGA